MHSQAACGGKSATSDPLSLADREISLFLSYRQADGRADAKWLNALLDGTALDVSEGFARVRVHLDLNAPGSDDWRLEHFAKLEASDSLLVIVTPGVKSDLSREGSPDWVYEELSWWCSHRATAPIVIDTTGQGDRWVPDLVLAKWPDVNRIDVVEAKTDASAGLSMSEALERVRERIVSTLAQSGRSVALEKVDHLRKLNKELEQANDRYLKTNRRLRAIAVAATLLFLAASSAALWAVVQTDLARRQSELARREAGVADSATSFLGTLFARANPELTGAPGLTLYGPSLTARQVLEVGARSISEIREPEIESRLLREIGRAYNGLELTEEAIAALRAAEARMDQYEETDEERLELNLALGEAYFYAEQDDASKAHLLDAQRQATELYRRPHENESAILVALGDLELWSNEGELSRADSYFEQALAIDTERRESSRTSGNAGLIRAVERDTARDYNRLGISAYLQGEFSKAADFYSEGLAAAEAATSPLLVARGLHDLAAVNYDAGAFAEAERAFRESAETFRAVYGPESGELAYAEANLGRVLLELGRMNEASESLQAAVRAQTAIFGPDHFALAYSRHNLGVTELALSGSEQARQSLLLAKAVGDSEELDIRVQTSVHIAETYMNEADLQRAAQWLDTAMQDQELTPMSGAWRLGLLQSAQAELLIRRCERGTRAEIERLLAESSRAFEDRWEGVQNVFNQRARTRKALWDRAVAEGAPCSI